jgi:hypothetical protein
MLTKIIILKEAAKIADPYVLYLALLRQRRLEPRPAMKCNVPLAASSPEATPTLQTARAGLYGPTAIFGVTYFQL